MNAVETGPFTVLVRFNSVGQDHQKAIALLDEYIGGFLAQQPGFLQSWLHETEGELLHYAQWRSEPDFRAFAERAADHPLLPAIRTLQPAPAFFTVVRSYPADTEA